MATSSIYRSIYVDKEKDIIEYLKAFEEADRLAEKDNPKIKVDSKELKAGEIRKYFGDNLGNIKL